jgi:hypothetical protein
MIRIPFFLALCLPGVAAAQTADVPRIEFSAAAENGSMFDGEGIANVSGKIVLPPGWKVTVHVITIRYAKEGGTRTINALIPVKGAQFSAKINLTAASYAVWAVIDVKDAEGRERQISSDRESIAIE